MKRFFFLLFVTCFCITAYSSLSSAANTSMKNQASPLISPTFVLLKFSNDTRFKALDADEVLSDLVLEKILESNLFQVKETRPISDDMVHKLYDDDVYLANDMRTAMETGDFNALFEGASFQNLQANTISTAEKGQMLDQSITSAIGNAHGAEYLVQGTIINLGRGSWLNSKTEATKGFLAMLSGVIPGGASAMGAVFSIQDKKTGVGVQSDLRIIRADTGEVVWNKKVTTICKQDKGGALGIYAGSDRLSMTQYTQALDQAAQEIVDALITDLKKGTLFVKPQTQHQK